jgi:hypothetical protein
VPCALLSHTTGALRGDPYRWLPLRCGIRTPR